MEEPTMEAQVGKRPVRWRVSLVITAEEHTWLFDRARRLMLGGGMRQGPTRALREVLEDARARDRRPLARLLRRLGWSR